ncbi:ATP-grasp domain-containing protein [Vibrio parahaemolyticus]|uniref:ATP-grasp domain-containing protein n=1 Tax=Vibrio parahaemolyticus TaxID=670 RepID=UPI0006C02A01|nr:DUF4343 domain-containing protein [Vibrio parahaemolyticus]KOY32233.1 hypothetical protein ACX10_26335 [Vibrio parahaemolyticus]
MKKSLIIAIEFENLAFFENALEIAGCRFNEIEEDMTHCLLRERGKEVLTCRELGIPYLAYLKPQTKQDRQEGKFSIAEVNFDIDSLDKDKFALVVRKQSNFYPDNLGFDYFIDKATSESIKHWAELFTKDEIGRNVEILSQADFLDSLQEKELSFPFFLKTLDKGSHGNTLAKVFDEDNISILMPTSERPDLDVEGTTLYRYLSSSEESLITLYTEQSNYFNPWIGESQVIPASYKSLDGKLIKSDVINILDDLRASPNKEHRAFIVDGKVTSLSRYFDYEYYVSPKHVQDYAQDFASKFKDRIPLICVADFAETTKGVELIEINPYENSGRYLMNDPEKLFLAIMELSDGDKLKTSNEGLFIPKIKPKLLLDEF